MIMLLDDPSPLVRLALAETLASSELAPPPRSSTRCPPTSLRSPVAVLRRSPLLVDADLVEHVATGGPAVQAAIASRAQLPRSVAAAIAEVGSAEACLILLENPDADIAPCRSGASCIASGISPRSARPCWNARSCRPPCGRRWSSSCRRLWPALSSRATGSAQDRAQRVAREACEKATVTLAAETPFHEVRPLIRHLRETGQLNAGLVLRALLSGNLTMFEEAMAELSGLPHSRVVGADARQGQFRLSRAL